MHLRAVVTAGSAALIKEMQSIARDEGGVVILMISNMVDAANTKVKFETPAGNQELWTV